MRDCPEKKESMLIVQEKLISEDVVEEQFLCDLKACKGACCWEGDWGAPLEREELRTLERIYPDIRPFLSIEGVETIERNGLYAYYEEAGEYGTALQDNGACVFMIFDLNGVAKCGIEQAYRARATDFQKPISCHLYPVRVVSNPQTGFEALNYDRWQICKAACERGRQEQLPVYRFVREALIRKYGQEFYDELDAAARHVRENMSDL